MEEVKPTPEPEIVPFQQAPSAVDEERKPVQMQRVFIRFSNGKVAVFSGPAIFSSAELKLTPVQIADIAFSEPFEMMVRVPTGKPNETSEMPPK